MADEIQKAPSTLPMGGIVTTGNSIVAFAQVKATAGEIFVEGKKLVKQVRDFEIALPGDVDIARQLLSSCVALEKQAEKRRTELVKPVNDYVSEINNLFKLALTFVKTAKVEVNEKMVAFDEKQRKIREEAEAKARAEREAEEKRIREEQAKRDAEEAKRREAEQKKLDEEKAKVSEEQAKILEEKAEIERQQREIQEQQRKLNEEKELMELKKKQEMDARIAERQTKVKGMRTEMKFDVEDENLVPRNYCSPDDKKIRAAIKLGIKEIPGVKIYEVNRVQ